MNKGDNISERYQGRYQGKKIQREEIKGRNQGKKISRKDIKKKRNQGKKSREERTQALTIFSLY